MSLSGRMSSTTPRIGGFRRRVKLSATRSANPRSVSPIFYQLCLPLFFGLFLWSPAPAFSQSDDNLPIRVNGLMPVGVRNTLTESWGALQFTVENPNSTPREARVVVFYPETSGVQYAKDVWIPPRSSVTSSVSIGPAPEQVTKSSRKYEFVLYDRTGGKNERIFPSGEQRVREGSQIYRPREQTTALMADMDLPEPGKPDSVVPKDLIRLSLLPRLGAFSENLQYVSDAALPLAAEALNGVDVFVVAGDRLGIDPTGRAALRTWVQKGGRLWVMLDRLKPETVAAIMGDEFDVGIIDRVGLTTVQVRGTGAGAPIDPSQALDEPVTLVRSIPGESDRVIAVADGWPAAFVRRVGRGKILFTTLGPRGWWRPRTTRDGDSPFKTLSDFPTPLSAVTFLSSELHPPVESDPMPPEVFQSMLSEEIGYQIVDRRSAAIILVGFVVALTVIGLGLRRTRRPELAVLLLPVAAALASVLFVFLGERSRRSIPPTIAIAGLVDPTLGGSDSLLNGLFASYKPGAGPVTIGSNGGAEIGLDREGLEGKTLVRLESDTDKWKWDGLELPAGARTGRIQTTLATGRISAIARFGPNGLEGEFKSGNLIGLSDAMILSRSRDSLDPRFQADGKKFTCGPADAMGPGQYLTGSLLTDRQQRRQEIVRRIMTPGSTPKHLEGRDSLLVWADSPDLPVLHEPGTVVTGNLLVALPIEYQKTAPATRVVIPRGLIGVRRNEDGKTAPINLTGSFAVDMRLRFQMPPAVLPVQLSQATLHLHIRAPFRKMTVKGTGAGDAKPVTLLETEAPAELMRIEIKDPSLLQLDAEGGLYLNVAIGAATAGESDSNWKIELISLEAAGTTGPGS